MNSLQHLPEDIRSEFSIDNSGQAFASRRAIARLAGVSNSSVSRLIESLSDALEPSSIFESFTGQSFESDALIPDTLVSLILEYYAYECQPRHRSEQAKQVCRVFRAIGFRMWVQQELNWQQQATPTATPLTALEYAKKALSLAGLESPVVESWGLVTLANKIDAPNKEIYLDAQKLIASRIELSEELVTVTELCKILEGQGTIIKPQTLNKLLCQMGLQTMTRDNKNRIVYQLTEASEGMGKLILNSTGAGKNVAQLKWYASKVLKEIQIAADSIK